MAVFVLNYDLVKEKNSFDYEPLWAELRRLNAHRAQYSAWLVSLDLTAKQVVEHFKQFVDSNDRLMAVKLTKDHWYINAFGGTNAWLERRSVS